MKRNLLHVVMGVAIAMMPSSLFAQDNTETVSVKNDVTLRNDGTDNANANKAYAKEAALEMRTSRTTDENIAVDFVGLMSFQIPAKTGYKVKSATLRLVTERAKGTMAIYALGSDISDADTYNSQKENLFAARQNGPITTVKLNGTANKAVTDAGASSNLEDWVNQIDITDYVKSFGSGVMNLMLANNADNTTNAIKVYSSDAKDVTNTNVSPNFTFKADDLKPQLTLVYEEDADQVTSVLSPTADTYFRKGNTAKHGSEKTIEICTYDGGTDATKAKDFVGAMSFELPAEALTDAYEIQSVSLRLVSERVKGAKGLNVYAYSNFDENATYANEEAKIAAAKTENNLITKFDVKGASTAMGSDQLADTYKTVDAWTNTIDLTAYAKALENNKFSILLVKNNSSEAIKFYTKDQKDNVTNKKDASIVFKAEDLVPQLTIVYSKKSADTYTLAVTEAKAATLVLPYDAIIPENVKAYTLTYTSGATKATATEVTGNIPANTPVLINAEKGDYTFESVGTRTKTENPESGALKGVWAETTAPQGAYVLQNQNGVVAFYKVTSNDIKVKANQAYLWAGENASSRSIDIDFGGTTGIAGVKVTTDTNSDAIYTLSGVRVNKNNLKKNVVYISNGKAFVIK